MSLSKEPAAAIKCSAVPRTLDISRRLLSDLAQVDWFKTNPSGPPRSIKFIAPYTWKSHGGARNSGINKKIGPGMSQPQLRPRWIIGASDRAWSIGNRCKNLSGTIHNFIYFRSNRYRKLWIIFQTPIPKFIRNGSWPPGRKTKSLFSIFHNISISILYYLYNTSVKKLFIFANVDKMYKFVLQNHVARAACSSGTRKVMKE